MRKQIILINKKFRNREINFNSFKINLMKSLTIMQVNNQINLVAYNKIENLLELKEEMEN